MFTDNFDWTELRKHFVRGVLDSDILGNNMFAHVIDDEYAARIVDVRTYDSIRFVFI